MKRLLLLTTVLPAILLGGCKKEDNYEYPAVVKEFVTLKTGIGGEISSIITDWNETYLVNQDKTNARLKPQSYYRAVSNYLPLVKQTSTSYGSADLYSAVGAYAGPVVPAASVSGGYKTAPVKKVSSIWKRGKYINMELLVMAKDQQHTFGFINDGKKQGSRNTMMLKIAHDNNNDYPAYQQSAYLSIQLTDIYDEADSVAIMIKTEKGWEEYKFSTEIIL